MKFLDHWGTVAALCLLSMDTTYANNVQLELQRNPATSIIGPTSLICSESIWRVSLLRDRADFCSDSLIAADWVLSAAHCVEGPTTGLIFRGAASSSP